jgi:hypothetical protein
MFNEIVLLGCRLARVCPRLFDRFNDEGREVIRPAFIAWLGTHIRDSFVTNDDTPQLIKHPA